MFERAVVYVQERLLLLSVRIVEREKKVCVLQQKNSDLFQRNLVNKI